MSVEPWHPEDPDPHFDTDSVVALIVAGVAAFLAGGLVGATLVFITVVLG